MNHVNKKEDLRAFKGYEGNFFLDRKDPKIKQLLKDGWTLEGNNLTKQEGDRIAMYCIVDLTGQIEPDPIYVKLAHLNLTKRK